MKKLFSLLLVFAMTLSVLAGCGGNSANDPVDNGSNTPSTNQGTGNGGENNNTPAIDYANSTVILYTGNIRGNVEVYSQISAAKAAYEAKGATVYLVDAGNYLQGTAYANTNRGLHIYELMDAAGYDVAGMGVYDFVHGEATTGYIYHSNLTRYFTQAELYRGAEALEYQKNAPWAEEKVMDSRAAKAAAGFTVICSNLSIGAEATGYYAFEENTVLGDALKVGFVSNVPENVASYLQDNFLSGYMLQNVTAPACDVVVALGGGNGDIVIEAATDGEMVVGAYVIDNTTKTITEETVALTGSNADVDALIAAIETSPVVFTSKVILDGSDRANWNGATNLGALTADALKWYAENKVEGLRDVPVIAIQNGGNCDNFIYAGDVTEVDLLRALPFSPMGVGILYLTGAEILETLEASTQNAMCPGWAQVSGIAYTVDTGKPYDAGEAYGDFFMANSVNRVTVTTAGFDLNATYAVIADNFLMNGNDTYYTFGTAKESGENYVAVSSFGGLKTRDIVVLYVNEVMGGVVGSNYTGELDAAEVESTLNKIVIFNSSLGTVLSAFGKTDVIVGAYGSLAETYGVPSCGSWNDVDVEAVIATGADAVFTYASYIDDAKVALLKEAGIFCYFIELSDATKAAHEVTVLGELFGCEEKAQVFVDLYNKYDALLNDRLAGVTPLNVYVEGTSSTAKTANSATAAHTLVVGAGGVNIAADNETKYPERDLEWLITQNPDVIVKLCGASANPADAYDEYVAGLAGVAAADNGKVILLNNEVGTTAVGSIIGRLYIAKYLYPETFADIDVDAVYAELCQSFFGTELAGSGMFTK